MFGRYTVIMRAEMLKPPLTGRAQPATDTVKRAMEILRQKPALAAPERPAPGDPAWRPGKSH
jgi:hypothetical protein